MKKRTNDVLVQYFKQTLSEELTLQELLQAAANAFTELLQASAVYFFTEKGTLLPPSEPARGACPHTAEPAKGKRSSGRVQKARPGSWPAAPPEPELFKKIETCLAGKAGRSVCVCKKDAAGRVWRLFWLKAKQAVCGAVVCAMPAAPDAEMLSGAHRLAGCVAPRFAALAKKPGQRPVSALSEDTAAMLSHEFKTPLTGALTSLQLLRRKLKAEAEILPEGAGQYLDYAELNLYKALRLAINLVEAQYAGSGRRFVRPEYTDLAKMLAELVESTQPYAEITGVRLVFENCVGEGCGLVCDVFYLERILLNLLSNAFRYAPQNSLVRVALQQGEAELLICVEDEGPGISQEMRECLFQKFRHGPGEHTGAGLGLYLSQCFSGEMGGTLHAENRPQGGARFTLCLPRTGENASGPSSETLHGPSAAYHTDSRDTLLRIEFSELLCQKCI